MVGRDEATLGEVGIVGRPAGRTDKPPAPVDVRGDPVGVESVEAALGRAIGVAANEEAVSARHDLVQ
eukprot:3214033-Lingulodinium_polyedra.AAC.1